MKASLFRDRDFRLAGLVRLSALGDGVAIVALGLHVKDVTDADDEGGSIGKRYRRQGEIGTPWAVTLDHQTMEDDTAAADNLTIPPHPGLAEPEATLAPGYRTVTRTLNIRSRSSI